MLVAYFIHKGKSVIFARLWSIFNRLCTFSRSCNDDSMILRLGHLFVCMLTNEEVYKIPALYGSVKRHLEVDCHYQDQIWDRISSSLDPGLTTRSLIYIDSNMTYSLGQRVPKQTRNVVSHDIHTKNIQEFINIIWYKCKKMFYNVLNKYINPFLCDNTSDV